MHSVTNSAQRRLARVQAHVTANPTFSSNTTATTTTTNTTNTNTTTSNNTRTVSPTKTSSTAETNSPEDKSKDALKLRGWGYNDTHFFLNEDNQVELSGNRYPQAFPPNVKRVFPKLKEFMEDRLHMNVDETSFITEQLPSIDPPILNHAFVAGVQKLLPKVELYSDHRCRLRHGLGCTMEEVWSIRYAKKIGRVPDLVMYPKSHNEVEIIVKEAVEHDAVIIPYGGGTTVSGALQCPTNEVRCIVSLDMSRMCRIKWVDRENMTACIEAGTIGTEIERKLGNVGFIMGHEPDSYEHSTMGGWIATNASGMKKNVFGNIEDIVVNFKVVTPTGTMECGGNFPRVSAGPNIMNLIFGSEGTLGVVTEAVVRIRRVPESVVYGSAIFYNFHQGIQAMREVARQRCQPASIRLVDNEQFRLAQVFKPESATPTKDGYMSAIQQAYVIKYKGFDEHKMVAMTLLFQGANRRETRLQEKKVYDIVKQYGGMAGDATNGIRGYFLTYMIAYIRDVALDYRFMAESFETSVPWSKVHVLIPAVKERIAQEARKHNVPGEPLISARVTQTYDTGCCVYFYFGFLFSGLSDPAKVFGEIEHAARDTIIEYGGSISHHHGIGKHRTKWLESHHGPTALAMMRAIKKSIDPKNTFNSGNLLL